MIRLKKNQEGVVLITGLIILLLLTLLATMAVRNSGHQQKMSAMASDKGLSFEASESGIRSGELWLISLTSAPIPSSAACAQPCVRAQDSSLYVEDEEASWWATHAAQVSAGTLSTVQTQPYFYTEYRDFIPDDVTVGYGTPSGKTFYAITSRGTGGTNEAVSIIQVIYVRRY